MLKKIIFLFLLFDFLIGQNIFSQNVDSTSFRLNSRLSFYSFEKTAEMLLHIPETQIHNNLKISLIIGNEPVYLFNGKPGKKIIRLPFTIGKLTGKILIKAEIISLPAGRKFFSSDTLQILQYKFNEVKADRFTGGLITGSRQFFPFGFYCYSPVYPTLPEEEAVKGFNMISPYQKILPASLSERHAYMDRCAELGMKVNYNLLSVSGGGGVSSKLEEISEIQKRERLITEIKTFMDHPALLGWYISDEPNGNKMSPEQLEEIYRVIKDIDPWHPVSVVFMPPFLSALKYANALDIVMADPYPVPNSPITVAGDAARQLRSEFEGKKPVWIVPQAFGGGEWWGREPTLQEIRSMTYQAIISGARGIQYFVRHGLNSFPKSTSTWNECGRMALEIAEITPWLLSDEEPLPVKTNSWEVLVSAYIHNAQLLIIAVNKVNSPQKINIPVRGLISGAARVLFENRNLTITSGFISDFLGSYGTQAYLINIKQPQETIMPFKGNLLKDPGFEDTSSPGIPASCYAWNEGDRGATYFIDSREHLEGNHSLRLITPQENKSSRLKFFPINIMKGRSYVLSVWAKTDSVLQSSGNKKNLAPDFELGLGEYVKSSFVPSVGWRQFVTIVTIPSDSITSSKTNVILRMPGKGTAWFDMLQIFEATDINRSINPYLKMDWN